MPSSHLSADLIGLRQELSLTDPVDIYSSDFLRFVIRLSERLDIEIPTEHYARLATAHGCSEYLCARESAEA